MDNKENDEQVNKQQGTPVNAELVINSLIQEISDKTLQVATLKARISYLEQSSK